MRGGDQYTETLFSVVRLEEFVPANHPLRPVRAWVNDALGRLDPLFASMYSPTHRGGRPSIPPGKLIRAMLLQIFYSIRSERQLVEQISYNLLYRRFVGLAIDDKVCDHTVFSKNRDSMLKHNVVTALFNQVVEMAAEKDLLSGEHFSVDGTLLKAWAGQKSIRRKDGTDSDRPPGDWRGERRSNEPHASTTDPDSRIYRKFRGTASEPSYLGHVLSDNRHMRLTPSADKGYDTRGFVQVCRDMGVTPHVAQNTARQGSSAIDGRTTRHPGYRVSLSKRKRIEQCFGWAKTAGGLRQFLFRGLQRVDQRFTLTMAAYNLGRMRTLVGATP